MGKFDTCLLRPHANLHYLLTPPGLLRVREVPRRWGLLVCDSGRVRVVRKPHWQEVANVAGIEGAIARSLTAQCMRTHVSLDELSHDQPFGQQRTAVTAR